MATLSDDEKKKIRSLITELDKASRDTVLASVEAFGNWLYRVASDIWSRVRDALRKIWNAICEAFS